MPTSPTSGPRSDPSTARAPATLEFALLRGALEEIPFGVATTRGDVLLYANDALTRLFGAPAGGLEQKRVADLFAPGVFEEISRALGESRVFDGRIRVRTLDGRDVDVELHLEQYSSAEGTGGFLIARDVSVEVGALGRLVEQLAGAIFRMRVDTGAIEMVSPSISRLIGLDAQKCVQRPVLLTTLLSGEERERVLFLYRRMVKGELLTANAQVNVRRGDGTTRLLQIRASARRDTAGVVRHIDGVVMDASRDPDTTLGSETRTGTDRDVRDPSQSTRATVDLTYEVLREGSQHLNLLFREIRSLRAAIKANALPEDVASDLLHRLDMLSQAGGAAGALNRAARHALAGASLGATIGEVLDGVRATLGPTIGDHAVTVDAGDAAGMVIPENVDGLTLALTHLSLRAFRFAGSGSVHLAARRSAPADTSLRRGQPREQVLIEILGIAPPDLADAAMEISSDVLRTVQRPDEADVAHRAAQALIGAAGGTIEADDATFAAARSVVRLKLP